MILSARALMLDAVQVSPVIHECLADVADAIRRDPRVALGISMRALVLAIPALQVWAIIQGARLRFAEGPENTGRAALQPSHRARAGLEGPGCGRSERRQPDRGCRDSLFPDIRGGPHLLRRRPVAHAGDCARLRQAALPELEF